MSEDPATEDGSGALPGLVLWHSIPCRSVLSVFRWLARDYSLPVDIFVAKDLSAERKQLGWRSDEYAELHWSLIPNDRERLAELVESRKRMVHLLNGYQRGVKMRTLGEILAEKKVCFGGFSEAPLNFHHGIGRLLKRLYLELILKYRVARFVRAADFVVNLSGPDSRPMRRIGWVSENIIPFGYFPERLPVDPEPVPRSTGKSVNGLRVLVTGNFAWHRGHGTVIRAVALCKAAGIRVELRIAGDGPLRLDLERLASGLGIADEVKLLGLLPLANLQSEICDCDCMVGSGLVEPWGIRVNDAILLGKVCFVSDGMGVGQYIRELESRFVYRAGDHRMLSDYLVRFSRDSGHREALRRAAAALASTFEPRYQARILYRELVAKLGALRAAKT